MCFSPFPLFPLSPFSPFPPFSTFLFYDFYFFYYCVSHLSFINPLLKVDHLMEIKVRMLPTTKMNNQANLEMWLSDICVWVRPPTDVKSTNHLKTDVMLPKAPPLIPAFLHILSFLTKN